MPVHIVIAALERRGIHATVDPFTLEFIAYDGTTEVVSIPASGRFDLPTWHRIARRAWGQEPRR